MAVPEPPPVDALAPFSPAVRTWFATTFPEPTAAQAQGWPAIASGEHTLILAPTGSGKTLAAFLWGLDRLVTTPPPADGPEQTRLLYLSPLRALAVDVEKNLRAPLQGIALAAERLGERLCTPTVGMRTGDTSADERRKLVRHPPDLLITTPESLYLMLTSAARETLRGVEAVIIDEIHALAPTKRGAHLSLTLERLEAVRPPDAPALQRIGLSATQRPLDVIARFLGGYDLARRDGPLGSVGPADPVAGDPTGAHGPQVRPRPVTIVDAGVRKPMEIEVVVPVEDMGALGEVVEDPAADPAAAQVRRSIWPSIHPRLLDLVLEHRSTLIFVNARRLAERLATRLNELAAERTAEADEHPGVDRTGGSAPGPVAVQPGEVAFGHPTPDLDQYGRSPGEAVPELVRAHHGSLSREQRLQVEDALKRGELRGLVCTSSLELGIDMGAVDLVVQVESPGAVSRGLQRIGRAGHQVGEPSRGKLFPKHRNDLVEAAVVVDRMHEGLIEHTRYPRNPVDVLAQQVVAMAAMDDWPVADLARVVRAAAPYAEITDEVLHNVLDLLAGRYPSEEFGELRPRIVWDRVGDVVRGRAGAQRLAVTSGGTIPDRGLFGVFLPDGKRVGELDEEMVYESRPGETFLLGATTWRIEDITHERVVVTPAPGQPGKMPFWHGDGPGRPLELGRAVGAFVREIRAMPRDQALARLADRHKLDHLAARNLLGYLDEQAEAGGAVPDDRTVVVERFKDEIGDWRVCVLSPFGAAVHAPWGIALRNRLAEEWGVEVELMWSDDGIVLRLPEAVDELPLEQLLIDPDEADELVVAALPSTAMFSSRFREAAARALLLPRRRPDRRTPLWQQRQRAADLLQVASRYPDFPILLEATRECLNDVFDLPALREVLRDLRSRAIRVVAVETPKASPMAQSLLFGWIAVYMYEYDAPLAERRAAALALDRDLLRELLGAEELRELIDPTVLADLELELQCLADGRRARDADEAHDLLRRLGPLTLWELDARAEPRRGGGAGPRSAGADADGTAAASEAVHQPRPPDGAVGAGADGPVATASAGDAGARSTVVSWVEELVHDRRAVEVSVGGEARVAAAEDAARLRDALGVAIPVGLPVVFTDPVPDPVGDLVARYARTHGPFLGAQVARRYGLPPERVAAVLERLEGEDRMVRGEFRPDGVEREWCDPDVLRQIRRRSLAALRKEVEAVEPDALARFLPAWQGVGTPRRGVDGLVEVIGTVQGVPLPASMLESDVLPGRMAGYRPADLDELCTSGEVIWVGAGGVGARDGRVCLYFRDQAALLLDPRAGAVGPPAPAAPEGGAAPADGRGAPGPADGGPGPGDRRAPGRAADGPDRASDAARGEFERDAADRVGADSRDGGAEPVAAALLDALGRGGALFWPDLVAAAQAHGLPYDDATVVEALWDLVWAGRVTNDSLVPLRAYLDRKAGRRAGAAAAGPARARGRRPNLGRRGATALRHAGPPAAAGRWSLVPAVVGPPAAPVEVAHARARQLLERHGVVTREAVLAEGTEGGFAQVYPVLKALEERGEVRRGYFVAGLGGAQFALPGAVDRLRAAREPTEDDLTPVVLAATDPAQPFGAALPWPESAGRPARAVGARVVLAAGEAVAYLERTGRSLLVFPAAAHHPHWADALAALVTTGRVAKLEITKVDGEPAASSPVADDLRAAGFADGYRGLVLRRR